MVQSWESLAVSPHPCFNHLRREVLAFWNNDLRDIDASRWKRINVAGGRQCESVFVRVVVTVTRLQKSVDPEPKFDR